MIKTQIFAHRGASAYAPENTMEAFALAISQGADGLELDVQMTKDGQLIVIHDNTINRVSNGQGVVRDFRLEELREFSFAGKFQREEKVEIPTLGEVLELAASTDILLNIELKTDIYWYPEIEEKVLEAVRQMGMEERVIYSSFNHYSIQRIQKLLPEAKTAYLYNTVIVDAENYTKQNHVKGIHPSLNQVKMKKLLQRYLDSGLDVRVWTVDEKRDMRKLMKAGVSGIFTNMPDVALKVRRKLLERAAL